MVLNDNETSQLAMSNRSYNLSQIADILGATLRCGRLASATSQPIVSLLLTDSRSLTFAEQTLFFALITDKGDGHNYIYNLYQEGVRAFVISQKNSLLSKSCTEAWFLQVDDTLQALQRLAIFHRSQFSLPIVGITGSNGKTIVKEWLYQLLHDKYQVVRSPRSFNSQIGVPLSVWQLQNDSSLALFEAGISHPGEMFALQQIISPTIGILTNIGTAHQENFSDRMQKLTEKLQLFKNCNIIIYNADIPEISDALEIVGIGARSMSWTLKHRDAQIVVLSLERSHDKTSVRYLFLGMEGCFTISMTDNASIENAMNCLALLLYLGFSREEIELRFSSLSSLAMRLEVVEGKRGCLLINDYYNSDLTSLEIALEFQKRRSSTWQKRSLILSEIQETGLSEYSLCSYIANLCKLHKLFRFVGIGSCFLSNQGLFEEVATHVSFYSTTSDFLKSDELACMNDELLLLKGARHYTFESISEQLQLRRHETILQVDLDAIVHNLNRYRSHLNPTTKIVCMVKAFGYGNGSYELAKTLQDSHVDYLAVALADEGVELRNHGIHIPIMVMNPEVSSFRTIIDNRLEPEIYSFRLLKSFISEVEKMGEIHYPIHIKIDSGMHRLGFLPNEIDELLSCLSTQSVLKVHSVFSHFSGADAMEFDSFTLEQVRRFSFCADKLAAAFPHKILRHILNSAGIERFPQFQFDMCRLGIGLYGIEASNNKMGLRNVSTLKSSILQIKEITKEETVGYSRKGKLFRDSRIAMIPIGYADGYDRRLGNGNANMLVCGKRCPTIGNICMDVTFLDITNCPEAQEGDEVIVFGSDLSIVELADILKTIPYEVMSSISTRVKRLYYKE